MATAAPPTIPSRPSHLPTISASINLSALAHNLAEVRRHIPFSCEILAVVKADAYGHGAVPISRALHQLQVRRFGVSTVQEGITLREGGIDHSILVMGGISPSQFPDLLHYRLTPILWDQETASRLAEHLSAQSMPFPVHVKVETGMKRLGLSAENILPLLQSPPFNGILQLEGLMTHLADADNSDPEFTHVQLDRFRAVVSQMQQAGMPIPTLHVANSAGVLSHSSAHFGMVRPGLMLYGYTSMPCSANLQR